MAAFIALAVVFSPVGGSLIHDGSNVASAKGYKSGKRSLTAEAITNQAYLKTITVIQLSKTIRLKTHHLKVQRLAQSAAA
ncbi:hypothetical protein AAAC51_15800 [Priestia megaterium]